MRFLKVITIAMAVLIVVGTTALLAVIVHRLSNSPAPVAPCLPAPVAAVLDEPAGTRIVGIATAGDRLAVQLQGGGVDRVLLMDPHTGEVVGQISLRGGAR
jgi:hypothetical protein